MTKLEELEQSLSDLAAKEALLMQKLGQTGPEESFEIVESETKAEVTTPASEQASPYECKQLLLVLKDLKLLQSSLEWLKKHGPACYTTSSHLTIAFPWHEAVSCSRQQNPDQPGFKEIFAQIPNKNVYLFGFNPVQMTRGCVALCQHVTSETKRVPDLVVISGCSALNRREFEASDYTPLLEEILLKEAIQPVILMK